MEILWDETYLDANVAIADFPADNNNSVLIKLKKIAARIGNDGKRDVNLRYH